MNRGKKLRLRPWVVNTLWVLVAILGIVVLLIIDNTYTGKIIDDCLEKGNTEEVCYGGFR